MDDASWRHTVPHVRALAAVAALLCVLGAAAAVSRASAPGRHVAKASAAAASVSEATSTSAPDATTTIAGPVASTTTATTTTGQAASKQSPTTTRRTVPCRNSFDAACGPFYWDPNPGPNQPLTVQVTFSPENPRAGEPVTFHVVASDPDAQIIDHGLEFSDAPSAMLAPAATCQANRFGPWTPPPPAPDRKTFEETHTYASPGTYSVTAYAWSANALPGDTCHDPYGSGGEPWNVTVVVQ